MLGAGQATGWAKKRVCYLCVMREIIMRPEIQRRHIFVSLPWQPLIFHVIFALPASLEVLLSVSPQRRKYFSPYIYTRSYPFLLSTQLPLWITAKLVNCDHEREQNSSFSFFELEINLIKGAIVHRRSSTSVYINISNGMLAPGIADSRALGRQHIL